MKVQPPETAPRLTISGVVLLGGIIGSMVVTSLDLLHDPAWAWAMAATCVLGLFADMTLTLRPDGE